MSNPQMQAMIFAAGIGSRLKPLTDTMPKALVSVGGEPLLKRVLDKLIAAGFRHVVVNVHHFGEQIIDFLHENDDFGISISISDERGRLLDTGGGLKKAASLFDPSVPILIHNVDILSNVNLKQMYFQVPLIQCPSCGAYHLRADATLLVSRRKTKRYLIFDRVMRLVGWTNIETGEIKSPFEQIRIMGQDAYRALCMTADRPDEKSFPAAAKTQSVYRELIPSTDITVCAPAPLSMEGLALYAFSGIHIFTSGLFREMDRMPDRFSIIDFYLQVCDRYLIQGYLKNDLQLMDVGKIDTIRAAESFLQNNL